ncbi:MAG TPA: NarK family nitrate/nitrite MFS transporter [Thermoanaerobaculia bacterium]|nr:NarK family nitrate/nitrite MFS transporter [Thermoanaerobaculia bacterium]
MATHVLTTWNPEDAAFWNAEGKSIAQRNLWISIPALFLSFAVWMVWSVVVVNLPNIGFHYTTDQLFWLAALPGLSGATLRIFYSFMVPLFGGRRWTAISTASLLVPALGIGLAVQNPRTPYSTMLILSLLCGLGGGNFASSMSNISFFFPKAQKGTALGLNAGLGNLGVSAVQFVVPIVITVALFGPLGGGPQTWTRGGETKSIWLQNAGFVWVPFIAVSAIAAWFGMNDLSTARASFREQAVIFRRKHNWLMCWLYLGTFGSFIGYSAALPLLIKGQFPSIDPTKFAFLGPLLGALARPVGGWVSDKLGGAPVTFWNFIVMTLAAIGVIYTLDGPFWAFLALFILLFITTGIGNASTFRMIPIIFPGTEAAAVLGFSSAIAAYGGFFIPKSFGTSIAKTGGPQAALIGFVLFYLTCIAITWWYYSRKNAEVKC